MAPQVSVRTVAALRIAAVRRRARPGEVGLVWGPALDLVWQFLRRQPGLRTDGHNVFVYHHPTQPDGLMDAEFGVEVARAFTGEGDVVPSETPAGEVAAVTHVGGYDRLGEAHAAIHAWCAANGRALAGHSCEIYGDWNADPQQLRTEVMYFLRTVSGPIPS